MERDSIAASFRFNDVVDKLQAKLGRAERLLRPVEMVRSALDQGALVSNPEAGAVKDGDLGVKSLVSEKWNLILARCLPEFRSRSFEDPDRAWHDGEGAGSGCRDSPGSRVSSGYGSIGNGRRGSSSVRLMMAARKITMRAERRVIDLRAIAGTMRQVDSGFALTKSFRARRSLKEADGQLIAVASTGSASRSLEAPAGNYPRNESGYRIRFDEEHSSSGEEHGRMNRTNGRRER